VDFIGRLHPSARNGVFVLNLPPPLVTDDRDGHRAWRLERRDGTTGPHARGKQDEQDERRDADRDEDGWGERRIVSGGDQAVALTRAAEYGNTEKGQHDHEHR